MPYPPWLMKYKKPGIYFQKKDEKTYRVIRAHSERVPEKKYPKLVVDEYIGTATEERGLVPYMPKVKGEVIVKRYGLYWLVNTFLQTQRRGPGFCPGYLLFAYGKRTREIWELDWISEVYEYRETGDFEAKRVALGLENSLRKRLGGDYDPLILLSSFFYRVQVHGQWKDACPQGWHEMLENYI